VAVGWAVRVCSTERATSVSFAASVAASSASKACTVPSTLGGVDGIQADIITTKQARTENPRHRTNLCVLMNFLLTYREVMVSEPMSDR
jgi:hypothetical protein